MPDIEQTFARIKRFANRPLGLGKITIVEGVSFAVFGVLIYLMFRFNIQ